MQTVAASITPSRTVIPADATPIPTATMVAMPDISDWAVFEDSEHGFRLRYPPIFTHVSSGGPNGPEILLETVFYVPAECEPGATKFNAIGLEVIDIREQFDSVQAWIDAHVIGAPGIVDQQIHFVSYQVLRSFPVNGQEAILFSTESVWGITSDNVMIPLSDFKKFAFLLLEE